MVLARAQQRKALLSTLFYEEAEPTTYDWYERSARSIEMSYVRPTGSNY